MTNFLVNPDKRKLLLISQNFPPELTASTVLVNNIFKYYKGDFTAIAGFVGGRFDSSFHPPCKTYYLTPPDNYILKRIYYKVMPRLRFINKWLMLRIARKENPSVIFGNYPEPEFFISSYEVSKKLNVPFYSYFHDLWTENMHSKFELNQALKWEELIVKNSKKVICCSEFQQEYFKSKYNIESLLLLHPVPDDEVKNLAYKKIPHRIEKNICFVGSLSNAMNTDALITLSKAVKLLPSEYKIDWYPIQEISIDYLKSIGFETERITIHVLPTHEMKKEVSNADILFAPLSFKNCSEHEVKTVFSNKILTYLPTGRPILVFSPPDSYHSTSARNDGWGYVVDKDDINTLANSILHLANNEILQEKVVNNAIKEANKRKASYQADKIMEWILDETQ